MGALGVTGIGVVNAVAKWLEGRDFKLRLCENVHEHQKCYKRTAAVLDRSNTDSTTADSSTYSRRRRGAAAAVFSLPSSNDAFS